MSYHKILRLKRLRLPLCVSIRIRDHARQNPVPQIRRLFSPRLNRIVGQPPGEFQTADAILQLSDSCAKRQR